MLRKGYIVAIVSLTLVLIYTIIVGTYASFFKASASDSATINNLPNPRSAGLLYMQNNNLATNITKTNTPTIVAGPTTLSNINDFDMPANNRLRYTGTLTKTFKVSASISHLPNVSTNLCLASFMFYKNTTLITGTNSKAIIGNDGDVPQNSGVECLTSLATNDYITVMFQNYTEVKDHKVTDMQLVATEI